MFASPLSNQNPGKIKSSPSLRKYLTQRTLAVLMFVAFAILASIGGKESKPATIPGIKPGEARDSSGQGASCPKNSSTGARARARFLRVASLFADVTKKVKESFNDPRLIEYGREEAGDSDLWVNSRLGGRTDQSNSSTSKPN